MTVPVQQTIFPHVANGITTDFSFECLVLSANDLVVSLDEVETTTGFTVSGVGNQGGGTVSFTTPPANGVVVTIERIIKMQRLTDYQQNGDFLSKVVNPDFDRLWMALQQFETVLGVQAGSISRVLTLGLNDTSGSGAYRALQNRIQDLADPVGQQDAATKNWVQTQLANLSTDGTGQFVLQLLAAAAGTTLVNHIAAGTGAVARTSQAKLRDFVNAADYGAITGGSDQTSKVQLALNALGTNGGLVTVNKGTKFNIKNLTFPARCNIEYWADDDTATSPQYTPATNEKIMFAANAAVSGGIVNEWRFTAGFHPGLMIDVRKDIPGHDAYLGSGQSRTDVVRASLNIHDEEVDTFRLIYENNKTYSQFSNSGFQGWRRMVFLNGIGTAQWSSVPVANTLITGQTSGATGHLAYVDATKTALFWYSGTFVAGEKLIDNNETTVATVSSVTFTVQSFNPLAQDLQKGYWSIGLPAGAVKHHLAVGGKIAVQRSRSMGQYEETTVTDPAIVLMDSCELSPPNGYEITYDTAPAAASRRVVMRKYGGTANLAHVGAVTAHASVGDSGSAILRSGSFNIASVVRSGSTGQYNVTFTTALASANYRILLSSQFKGFLAWDLKTTAGFSIFVNNTSGAAQWAPFDFDFVVVGGDI